MVDKQKQGRRNKAAGARFEKKTREDLESKGWIVSKWQNIVEFEELIAGEGIPQVKLKKGDKIRTNLGKCVPAKMGRFRTNQGGFPDFIAYKLIKRILRSKFEEGEYGEQLVDKHYDIIFIECKTNGYLKPEEKEKARWYLKNNYCSKFFIAHKEKEGRRVVVKYKDFELYDKAWQKEQQENLKD